MDSPAASREKNVIAVYDHYTGDNARVFNGRAYLYYNFRMEGKPFFEADDLSEGWVSYEGKKYEPLSMLYDLIRNEVVILLPDSNSRAVLQNDLVDSFKVAGHTFISLKEDHNQNLYNTGFYDVLYNAHVQLLARRTKVMREDLKENPILTIISAKDFLYIHKDGLYYFVNNKKDVFRLFAGKKNEIRKMMRRQHLKLNRKTFENTLETVVAFYDQLIH